MPSVPLALEATHDRPILSTYLPLAASWLMMAAEMPVGARIVNSLPEPTLNMAALNLLFGLALFIESPVIDLLATSTTLSADAKSLEQVRKFTVKLMFLVTVVHLVFVMSPLFRLVTVDVLGIPTEVAQACHMPMAIMLPWSAAIGWRRFNQGLLIRSGRTRPISVGTVTRLLTLVLVGGALAIMGKVSGATTVALAVVLAVIVEAVYVSWAVKQLCPAIDRQVELSVSQRKIAKFHWPLTISTMVNLLALPLTSAALARSGDGVVAMAAWQTCRAISFMLATAAFALPEVVITYFKPGEPNRELRNFCLKVGVVLSLLAVVMAATRLDILAFKWVIGAEERVAESAHLGFIICSLLPVMAALALYVRGALTAMHMTVTRVWAVAASAVGLVAFLVGGVAIGLPGVVTASVALVASQLAEWAVMAWWLRKARRKEALAAA